MQYRQIEKWPVTRAEAAALQTALAREIRIAPAASEPRLIAAVDTAYGRDGKRIYAAAVVVRYPGLEPVDRAEGCAPAIFPYVPGLLFFREGPAVIAALHRLATEPDMLMILGHGLAHPARCGMAGLLGVLFNRPSTGCSRKLLAGTHRPVADAKGSWEPIRIEGAEVGCAYRSKDRVKPIFVSPGHGCDLAGARELVVRCLRDYRLPEPLRLAHVFANKYKRYQENGTAGRKAGSPPPERT